MVGKSVFISTRTTLTSIQKSHYEPYHSLAGPLCNSQHIAAAFGRKVGNRHPRPGV